jgi:hypothetical protein
MATRSETPALTMWPVASMMTSRSAADPSCSKRRAYPSASSVNGVGFPVRSRPVRRGLAEDRVPVTLGDGAMPGGETAPGHPVSIYPSIHLGLRGPAVIAGAASDIAS